MNYPRFYVSTRISNGKLEVTKCDLIWGGRRTAPFVFTEQGVAMLSSVLSSQTAIQVNISTMRVFVKIRQWAANYEELVEKIDALQQIQGEHNVHIAKIYHIIEELVKPQYTARERIGYKTK